MLKFEVYFTLQHVKMEPIEGFETSEIYKPDAGELPYRKFTIFSTRRKS